MRITGPYITKTVHIPAHDVEVFDEDAYWHLNCLGNEDKDGPFLYAKVAFPRHSDAHHQHLLEASARLAEQDAARAATRKKNRDARAARKQTAKKVEKPLALVASRE